MTTWKQVGGALTTESRARVYSDDGREGYVDVTREQRGAWDTRGPRFYGAVYDIEAAYNPDGTVASERKIILDSEPAFA